MEVLDTTHIPRTEGMIARPHLLELLAQAGAHKVILLSAPPGYGKTTIAAQFARRPGHPVAWYTVVQWDRDATTLHAYSLEALARIIPDIRHLPPPQGNDAAQLAMSLADYLRTPAHKPFFFVLDDLHHLDGSSSASQWLQTLVKQLPATAHILLLSRTLPDLPFGEMILRHEILAIGQEQLQFTVEEIEQLARRSEHPATDVEVGRLVAHLDGWPAGTTLALRPVPAHLEGWLPQNTGDLQSRFSALADAMMQAQPPGLQHFLQVSSIPTRFTPEICETLLELTGSLHWIGEAQRRNLFLSGVPGGLAYHPLFRAYLQQRLKSERPDRFRDLHGRVARWYNDGNRLEDAFEHFVAAAMLEDAAQIAERVAHAFFSQGKTETLLRMNRALHQATIPTPDLHLTCAMAQIDRDDYQAAKTSLARATKDFQSLGDRVGEYKVALQRIFIQTQSGLWQEAIAAVLPLLNQADLPANLRGLGLRHLGVARIYLGEPDQAVEDLEMARRIYETIEDDHATALLLQDLEVAYTRAGRMQEAQVCLQKAVAIQRRLGNPSALALALNNLGYHYHKSGNYRSALDTLQEGLRLIAGTHNHYVEGLLLWSLGDLQRDRGVVGEALHLYSQALEQVDKNHPALRCSVLTSMAILRRWQGDEKLARLLAEEAMSLMREHPQSLELALARAVHCVAGLARGNVGNPVSPEQGDLGRWSTSDEYVRVHAYAAQAALLRNDPQAAERALRKGMALLDRGGSIQALVAEIAYTPLLEEFVKSREHRFPTIPHLLTQLRDFQRTASQRQPEGTPVRLSPTYSLRIITLGEKRFLRDGQPVAVPEWRSDKARDVFLYLLFTGPHTREQISLVFWPESSPKRVRSSFHTTLHRIRVALGENVILFDEDLYRLNPQLDVRCDALEFETLTKQAGLLSPHNAQTDDLWYRALQLYGGEFLPSVDGEWVDLLRERYSELYLNALVGRGRCAHAQGDFGAAIGFFNQALALDPFREDVYRAMMRSHAGAGEQKQILSCWHTLKDVLRQELAIQPSRETSLLVEALTS